MFDMVQRLVVSRGARLDDLRALRFGCGTPFCWRHKAACTRSAMRCGSTAGQRYTAWWETARLSTTLVTEPPKSRIASSFFTRPL